MHDDLYVVQGRRQGGTLGHGPPPWAPKVLFAFVRRPPIANVLARRPPTTKSPSNDVLTAPSLGEVGPS